MHKAYDVDVYKRQAYIFGRTDSLMQAHDGIYRGEASATLYRLLKQNNKLGGFVYDINREPLFNDLAGRWDRSALEYMAYIGVYDPAATAAISPDQTISRGEAFKLFALALGYTNDTAPVSYTHLFALPLSTLPKHIWWRKK